jgi:hypothetical protein
VSKIAGRISALLDGITTTADLFVIEAILRELPAADLAQRLSAQCVAAVEPAGTPNKWTNSETDCLTIARAKTLEAIRAWRTALQLPDIPRPGVHVHLKTAASIRGLAKIEGAK